ncbi:helix-turn-helix transcriptional regulator [Kitasatospora xanthocidica]|uniref:helix-turn-helix transcriptional regulator n=1 Tax=Kitasatospora xanthocidica TaxID=83382 RepID=UPI00227D84C4|nr:LuxR family transcriptional regulator [Kitasatospora xanthocidica]
MRAQDRWVSVEVLKRSYVGTVSPRRVGPIGGSLRRRTGGRRSGYELSGKRGSEPRPAPTGLVGRHTEVRRWDEVLDLLTERGHTVEVVGDPGIGKTRLLAEFVSRAARRGARVLSGRAAEAGSTVPLHVYRDVLGERLDGDGPRPPRYDAVRRLLCRTAEQRPTVLVLDDLHWADPASAELTDYLIRHPVTAPFVLLLAHRPRQSPLRLLGALADGAAAGTVVRMPLAALDREACADLVAAHGAAAYTPSHTSPHAPAHTSPHTSAHTEAEVDRLHRQSGGNPLLLLALAAARRADPPDPGRSADRPPELVTSALLGEIAGLDRDARLVLDAAAVIGDRTGLETLGLVAGLRPDPVRHATADLVRRDLLRPVPDTGLFEPRHPLLARTVHEHTEPVWRLGAHRRALDGLTRDGGPLADRARHAALCLGGHDDDAVRLLEQAATEHLHHTPRRVLGWLEAADRGLPDRPSTREQRLRLALLRGRALTACGRLPEARALLHDTLRRIPRQSGALRTETVTLTARAERMLGRYPEAAALLAEPAGPGAGTAPGVEFVHEYGTVALLSGDYPAVAPRIDTAADDARQLGDHPAEALLRALAGLGRAQLGDGGAAVPALDRAAALVDGLADADLVQHMEVLAQLGWAEVLTDRPTDAARHLRRGLDLARRHGQRHLLPHLVLGEGFRLLWTGGLAAAASAAREAAAEARALDNRDLLGLALALEAGAAQWRDGARDAGLAVDLATRAVRAGGHPHTWWHRSAAMVLAQTQLAAGRPAECRRTVVEYGGGEGLPRIGTVLLPGALATLSTAALLEGDLYTAAHWADRAVAEAERGAIGSQLGFAERARAAVLAARGEHAEALLLFSRAADRLRAAGFRVHQAWTLTLGAPLHRALGRPADTEQWLRQAAALAAETGAKRVRERVRAVRQEAAAAHAAPGPDELLGSLTTRERQIAELVRAGSRTRDIATDLFLSPRTVESHLARVYRKLGVASRSALAAALDPEHTRRPG